MDKITFTLKSGNRKTGPIPVSISERKTCPNACPFKGNGCYAESWPMRLHWNNVESKGLEYSAFLQRVRELPAEQLWRHNAAGDLPGIGNSIHAGKLKRLVLANRGKRGFTYTHKPLNDKNKALIKEANKAGFTINLSANNLEHADQLVKAKIGPVVSVVENGDQTVSPAGNQVITCPATYKENVSCASCKLCQVQKRPFIIAFPVHGTFKKKALTAMGENHEKS